MPDAHDTAFPLALRARLARTIALVSLALDGLAILLSALAPDAMGGYPTDVMALVLAGPAAVQATIGLTPWTRLPVQAQEWLLRLLALTAVGAVVGAVYAQPLDNGVGFAFIGFTLALSAITLRARDHGIVLVLTTIIGLALVFAVMPEPFVALFTLLPGLGIGLMAGLWARAHGHITAELEGSRTLALEAGAALRAVVDGAHDAAVAEPEAVLQAIVEATTHLGADSSGLYVIKDDGQLTFGAAYGVPKGLDAAPIEPGLGLLGEVLRCDETVVIEDYQAFVGSVSSYVEFGLSSVMGTPVRLPDGRVLGVLVMGRNGVRAGFSDAAVDALELLADHAARALQLSREVDADRRTLRSLSTLLERQRDFVATVSHELRTPVTVITGLAATMARHGDALSNEQRDHLMERLCSNATSLTQIVESLLDTARLEQGLTAHHEVVDLGKLAVNSVERLGPLLAGHTVVVNVEDDALVRADEGLLARVVDNLLTNAQRHTPAGTTVEVQVRRQGRHVELLVRDDGPGIPVDVLPRIKERFVRAGDHRTRATRGLGIGLALADQVLRLHDSTLRVASSETHGSTFRFTLLHASSEPARADTVHRPRQEPTQATESALR